MYRNICFALILSFLAHSVSNSLDEEAFLPQGNTEFGILTSDSRNHSLLENFEVQSKCRWKYATRSGYRIEIYDDVLSPTTQRLLRGLLTYNLGSWSYRIPEEHVKHGQKHVSGNNVPWYNELNVLEFSKMITGKQLQEVVVSFAHEMQVNYVPYKAVGHILRRGDYPKVHVDSDAKDEEITMMIYLNPKWRKNDYGDLYLYDDDKEIIAGVVPRYGRLVVWHSSIPYLTRPPSVAFKPGQLFLHICFTKNQSKVQEFHAKWIENKQQSENIRGAGLFKPLVDKASNFEIPVQTHFVSESKSKTGKKIFVFDDLFPQDELDELRSATLNHGVYYYDDSYEEESDNVQWIAAFDVDHYIKSNMWKTTQQVAQFVSGGHSDWFPYDVSCNLIRNADTTQIHHDCDPTEDEWTFLLYLNPEWSINHYGETVFLEQNNDNTEIITEVLPKYGRVVIFQGEIPHSARPPSTNFSGARLSFAVKLSKTEWIGRQKTFREEFRHLTAIHQLFNIFEKLKLGRKEDELDDSEDNEASLSDDRSQTDETSAEDESHIDPAMSNSSDPELEEMESRLDALLDRKDKDIEGLRTLVRDLRTKHIESRDSLGELIKQVL